MRGEKDDRPVGAKRKLGTEDPVPRVEDVTEQCQGKMIGEQNSRSR